MQLNSGSGVSHTHSHAPPQGSGWEARKYNSKNGTKICEAKSCDLEDDLDPITIVFITQNI